MIAASEPVEYVPRGRQAVDTHPDPLTCSRRGSPVQSDIHLANRLQNVVLSDSKSSAEAEHWMLREREQTESKHNKNVGTHSSLLCDISAQIDCSYEEELYFSKNTAVWSKGEGLLSGSDLETEEYRNVICCYTCDTPIKHALFCTFHSTAFEKHTDVKYKNKKNTLTVPANKFEAQGKPIPSICLVDELNMRVFTESGEDYITSLEFQISNLFNTRFGIILQKEAVTAPIKLIDKIRKDLSRADASETPSMNIEPESANLPTLFSMNHPLDEACPLIIKYPNGSLNYANDASLKVVFSATDPSIVLVYDSKTGLHSIYRLRKALEEEYNAISNQFDTLSIFDLNSGMASVDVSQTNESLRRHGGLLHSRHSGSILGLGNFGSSPYSSRGSLNTPIMSPLFTPLNTPSPCRSLGSLHQFGNTSSLPRRQHSIYGFIDRSTPTGGTITPCDITRGTTCPEVPAPKPLYPDLCLEHLWTENLGVSTDGLWESASSCFLHCDLVGFTYLCYLQPTKEVLVITRMQIKRDIPDQIVFGAATTIPAKDAISLPKMNMIALLDSAGCVTLYSGSNQVGKIHVGGMLTSLPSAPAPSTSSHSLLSHTFTSPFPRRSSLLPTSTVQPEKHFEDLHLLSPVAPLQEPKTNNSQNQNSNGLQGLRDGIGNRITLQYSSGQYYRIGIPPISNCYFIRKCLIVLKQILQRDIAMQVMIRWYGVRNAPGSQNISAEQEWNMFQNLLLELIGYDIDKLRLTNENSTNNNESVVKPKKKKTCLDPTNNDWEFLLKSKYHRDHGQETANLLNFKQRKFRKKVIDKKNLQNPCKINTNTILFQHLPIIFFSIHLLYEELKLKTHFNSYLKLLVKLLFQLSYDLRLESYMRHYWKDFPELCSLNNNYKQSQLGESDFKKLMHQQYLTEEVPNIFKYIFDVIKMETVSPYPYIDQVNKTSKNLAQLANLFVYNPNDFQALENCIMLVGAQGGRIEPSEPLPTITDISGCCTVEEKAVLFMINAGISRKTISHLPPALSMLCCWAIEACRENPPTTWTVEAYSLLLREDLVIQKEKYVPGVYRETSMTPLRGKVDANNILPPNQADETIPTENDDGMENMDTQLFRLRFPDDLRITEVRRLLHSASPVKIDIKQSPEISGHELIEEQEKQLFTISTRTMALPYGRGMFTLRSTNACTTEPLPIPKLCLTGKATPKGTTVELTHIEVPPQMNLWPMFHNGVAAGLRISPEASDIDSTWIIYNKPQGTTAEMPTEHAGFLMALGLNGHLKNLAYVNIYDYLVKCHAMTSVGLLLGISATHRGTMDMPTTKLLSIHVEALLPPTSIELDIPQNIQVAALLGVGLVYEGTANRHIAEVLLSEIGRPPGPEMENSVEREAYSLAAGLGLGLVTLGQGGQMSGLTDLTIPDTLHYYMVGGTRRPLTGSQKEKYKMPSFQIREGDVVNIDVTAPGATLALGLMFFATGTQTVADWMKPPETNYLLDFVRPDLLLLRTISRGLILWNEIQPTEFWIEEQVPVAFRRYCLNSPNTESNIDYEGVNQAYCNILAGACFCIGLKYAGSANSTASQILSTYCRRFMRLVVKSIAELAGKSTVETCMNLILISLAMVMAGTGDLQTLRICRLLRGRVGVGGTTTANYGSHLATHAALGLLFLGAGRYSLSTAPSAVAAMVCAFFPKFPTHSNDNRYHLQAFRHLYVLAVEPRLLIPRDIDSGLLCYCHITVITRKNVKTVSKAPCLLPELHTLQSVKIEDDRYWPIVFEVDRNWDQLLKLLEKCFCLNIKQRAGCLSYQEDPDPGFKTLLAHTLSSESSNVWRCRPENIYSFSNDPAILHYTQQFLMINDKHQFVKDTQARSEMKLIQLLTMQTYECATKDMLHVLPYSITLFTALHQFHKTPTVYLVWQFKILYALVEVYNKLCVVCPSRKKNMLMTNETIVSILQRIQSVFDLWEDDILQQLKYYLTNLSNFDYSNVDNIRKVLNYITYYDIPSSINHNNIELYLSSQSNNLSSETILKLGKILN